MIQESTRTHGMRIGCVFKTPNKFKDIDLEFSIRYMSITGGLGRLCNQVIRSLAFDPIARKFDLYVDYFNHDQIKRFGFDLYSGSKNYSSRTTLNESNYWQTLQLDSLDTNLDASQAYFQTNEIIQAIYKYLRTPHVQANIIQANPFRERYQTNNDLCVHIRLTDVAKYNPGVDYYLNTIRKLQFDTLYICTDEPDHTIIQQIQKEYPELKMVTYDEVETIQFASTCKYIIISHGSYSAVIGYLSFFSSVYYPDVEKGKVWCPNIFSIKEWEEQSLNK